VTRWSYIPSPPMEDQREHDAELKRLVKLHMPRVLPSVWERDVEGEDGNRWIRHYPGGAGLSVIASVEFHSDRKWWLHVSVAHPNRLPSYDELADVKELFIGAERTAYQVMPPRSKHVNIHKYCLHLWHCIDGDVTPDFTKGGKTI
jgi:hypothetical protein